MRCEEVRPLLPDLAEGEPRPAGAVQVHLEGCAECTAELRHYRRVILGMAALREELVDPPDGFSTRVLARLPEGEPRSLRGRVAGDERVQHAALSLGGAVVGATAVGILWWRAARRRPALVAAGASRADSPV